MNWDAIALAVIAGTPGTIMALAAYLQARGTHRAVNHRMDELLAISKKSAADDATLAEKAAERARKGEIAVGLAADAAAAAKEKL